MIALQIIAGILSLAGVGLSIGLSLSQDDNPEAASNAWAAAGLFFLAFCVIIK